MRTRRYARRRKGFVKRAKLLFQLYSDVLLYNFQM